MDSSCLCVFVRLCVVYGSKRWAGVYMSLDVSWSLLTLLWAQPWPPRPCISSSPLAIQPLPLLLNPGHPAPAPPPHPWPPSPCTSSSPLATQPLQLLLTPGDPAPALPPHPLARGLWSRRIFVGRVRAVPQVLLRDWAGSGSMPGSMLWLTILNINCYLQSIGLIEFLIYFWINVRWRKVKNQSFQDIWFINRAKCAIHLPFVLILLTPHLLCNSFSPPPHPTPAPPLPQGAVRILHKNLLAF